MVACLLLRVLKQRHDGNGQPALGGLMCADRDGNGHPDSGNAGLEHSGWGFQVCASSERVRIGATLGVKTWFTVRSNSMGIGIVGKLPINVAYACVLSLKWILLRSHALRPNPGCDTGPARRARFLHTRVAEGSARCTAAMPRRAEEGPVRLPTAAVQHCGVRLHDHGQHSLQAG